MSYVYILSGQKLIENSKSGPFKTSFWRPKACGQTVLSDRLLLIGQKLVENTKIEIVANVKKVDFFSGS